MSQLFIVATPIGNLADITFRAVETLKSVDIIACEDTRNSRVLLDHYQIKKPLISYHQHSGETKVDEIIALLKVGKNLAVITDAGTPGISDPGNKLVAEVINQLGDDCQIIAIPGASAVVTALAVCGLPTDKFLFLGFMPHKKGKETMMRLMAEGKITSVFYESTHRILKTLNKMVEIIGESRKIVVCRELTKKFETIYRGSLKEVAEKLNNNIVKGEFVVIVSGNYEDKNKEIYE